MKKSVDEKEEVIKTAKYGSVIKSCDCDSVFQDTKYGSQQRVHNITKLGKGYRCTVCGKNK